MIWLLFILLILVLLALDLGVFHKTDEIVSTKSSLIWTLVWVCLAIAFGGVIFWVYDQNLFGINQDNTSPYDAMLKYFTGFVVEKSLSLDNIFVIAVIFTYFKIEAKYQHNILFWGILGAIIFRGIMIGFGTAFVETFHWSTYIFGAILIYSAISMMTARHDDVDYYKNPALKLLSRVYPVDWNHRSHKYTVLKDGKRFATVSLATLIVIEFTDVLFAVDSIPAIFAITTDPFIVFTSNIFAILGLRNLYFFLANILDKFRYMKYSLVFILIFVGFKMGLANHYKFPSFVSLTFILGALLIGILVSVINGKRDTAHLEKPI